MGAGACERPRLPGRALASDGGKGVVFTAVVSASRRQTCRSTKLELQGWLQDAPSGRRAAEVRERLGAGELGDVREYAVARRDDWISGATRGRVPRPTSSSLAPAQRPAPRPQPDAAALQSYVAFGNGAWAWPSA